MGCTLTVNPADAVLPRASLAVQVTGVVPTAKVEPEAGVQVTGTLPETRSVAVGAGQVTTAPLVLVAVTVMFAGIPDRTGGVVSTTPTVKVAVAGLPAASEAEQVTVVVPSGKTDPGAG
jgi:hypothetical protein